MSTTKINAGAPFPDMSWPATSGGRVAPRQDDGWRLLIVYRGKHCPLCRQYLESLNGLLGQFEASGIKVAALSADPREKAEAQVREQDWRFPVGYDLSPDQMSELGLYVSDPRSPQETDRPFSEPGLFAINPQGQVQIVDISNAPFARPDLTSLLGGLKFVIANDYPIRGRA